MSDMQTQPDPVIKATPGNSSKKPTRAKINRIAHAKKRLPNNAKTALKVYMKSHFMVKGDDVDQIDRCKTDTYTLFSDIIQIIADAHVKSALAYRLSNGNNASLSEGTIVPGFLNMFNIDMLAPNTQLAMDMLKQKIAMARTKLEISRENKSGEMVKQKGENVDLGIVTNDDLHQNGIQYMASVCKSFILTRVPKGSQVPQAAAVLFAIILQVVTEYLLGVIREVMVSTNSVKSTVVKTLTPNHIWTGLKMSVLFAPMFEDYAAAKGLIGSLQLLDVSVERGRRQVAAAITSEKPVAKITPKEATAISRARKTQVKRSRKTQVESAKKQRRSIQLP